MKLEIIENPLREECDMWLDKVINQEVFDPDINRERYLCGHNHIVDKEKNILFKVLGGPSGGAQDSMHINCAVLIFEGYYLQPRYCKVITGGDQPICTHHFYDFKKWGDPSRRGVYNLDRRTTTFIPPYLEDKTELIKQYLEELITYDELEIQRFSNKLQFKFHWDTTTVDPSWPKDMRH